MVFIDGQNAAKTTQSLYGHMYTHPLLLAQRLLHGRSLCGVRYYSGIHDPRVNPTQNAIAQRRHDLMQKVGVTIVQRKLRYRWEWGFDQDKLADPFENRESAGETVIATPYQRAREKGIDLTLGLDVVDLALARKMDVAVIVSSDTDLTEVARAVHQMTRRQGRVSVEAALFTDEKGYRLEHYDFTQMLRRADFDACKDSFNYRQPVDPIMAQAFKNACASIQPQRS